MADLTITASQVIPSTNASYYEGIVGTGSAVITQGQPCYVDSATNTVKRARANSTAAIATVRGIAINSAAAGQYIKLQTGGLIDPGTGAAAVEGMPYLLSNTSGGIMPVTDLTTAADHYVSIIGVGISSYMIQMSIFNSGVEYPTT